MEPVENQNNKTAEISSANGEHKIGSRDVYTGTKVSLDELLKEFPYYNQVMGLFRDGTAKVELRKRFMLKMIDEVWVRMIEDTIPSLDVITRRPGHLLAEEEEILPIELTKKVTSRSVQHLSMHTDYINEVKKDGTVMPSKLLNVFQDETVLTYENRFINTLINRLFAFVIVRYDAAEACGEDEKNTMLTLHQEFTEGEKRGKITLTIEVAEPPKENEVVKNYFYSSDLWKRVVRIRKMVTAYMDSPFAHELGKNFVRPPVMRTNMLLKNVNFRQCLALWEFMETYENTGYESLIQEDLETVSADALADFYKSMVEQYVLFQKHIRNDIEEANALDERLMENTVSPEFKDELDPFTIRDYDRGNLVPDGTGEAEPSEVENDIEQAILIALAADDMMVAEEEDEEEETAIEKGEIVIRYRYSFLSRLILAQNPTQDFYTEIKNYLLSFKKVKSRISWNHETFNAGRRKCARVNVKGKTVFLYLPLDPNEYIDSKYHIVDVSDTASTAEVPCLLRVRSNRGVKYAKELIDIVMAMNGLVRMDDPEVINYHLPYATRDEMLTWNPPLVKIIGADAASAEDAIADMTGTDEDETLGYAEEESAEDGAVAAAALSEDDAMEAAADTEDNGADNESDEGGEEDDSALAAALFTDTTEFIYRFRYSFTARLIQAPEYLQGFYGEVKNYLLSYNKVKANTAWAHESFRFGRGSVARIKIRGKSVLLYLTLSPADYVDTKYHVKDLTDEDGNVPAFPLLFKVRSARGVKYAKELIDDLMKSLDAVQGEIPTEDYSLPYQTKVELLSLPKPLIKTVRTARTVSVPVEPAPAEETAQPSAGDSAVTPETPVEESPATIEPVTEEAPAEPAVPEAIPASAPAEETSAEKTWEAPDDTENAGAANETWEVPDDTENADAANETWEAPDDTENADAANETWEAPDEERAKTDGKKE